MFKVEVTGLDKLQQQLKEAQEAAQQLDGTIAELKFNPHDQDSVQSAIREMESRWTREWGVTEGILSSRPLSKRRKMPIERKFSKWQVRQPPTPTRLNIQIEDGGAASFWPRLFASVCSLGNQARFQSQSAASQKP